MKRNVMHESRGGGPLRTEGMKLEHSEGEDQTQANMKEIYDLEWDYQQQIRKSERGKVRIMEDTRLAKDDIKDNKIID